MKNKLSQYVDLEKEVCELNNRVEKTRQEIEKIKEEGTVIDMVKGGEGGLQNFRIEGFPNDFYYRKKELLVSRIAKLEKAEMRRIEALTEIEDFIENIEDSHIRRIISLRYIDGLQWSRVAMKMGRGYTEDSVRMSVNRYLKM